MTTITKAYSIKLIKPTEVDEGDWKFAGKILNDLDYMVKRFKNSSATSTYINNIGKLNGLNKLTSSEINKKVKQELSQTLEYQKYAAECINSAIKIAHDKVNKDFLKILKGEESLTNYKDNQPIPIRNRQIAIEKEEKDYFISLGLLSRDYASELGRTGKNKARIKFLASSKGKEKIIMDRILSGEYKLCDSSLQKKKDKEGKSQWYFIATYQFEKEDKFDDMEHLREYQRNKFGQPRILGVDLGISKAAYMAVSNSPVSGFIEGGEIEQFRNKVEYRRKQMRNQLKWASDNRRGHGRKTLLKPLEKLESKVSDFRKLTNHRYAKHIVNFAIKNQCSIIQMEDLSGVGERSAFMKRWSYYDLQSKVKSKAEEYGIEVRFINPKYTSQRCHNCGVISKDNREDQATYKCSCQRKIKGELKQYKINADLNAARNIAMDGIEQIIYEQALSQGLIKPKEDKKKTKKEKVS